MKTKKKDIVGIIISFLMIFFLIFPSISNRIMKNGLEAGRKRATTTISALDIQKDLTTDMISVIPTDFHSVMMKGT